MTGLRRCGDGPVDPAPDGRGLAGHLAGGGQLEPLARHTLDGLRLRPGEVAYADIPAHAAYYTAAGGQPVRSAGLLVLGPPRWMIAALLLNAALEHRARRAAADHAPGWREVGPVRLVLTSTRTLTGTATGWRQLPHADIAHVQPDPGGGAVVLLPGDGTPPLRLSGPWIGAYTSALTWLLTQPHPAPHTPARQPGPQPGHP